MKHPLASLFAGSVLSKAVAGVTLVGLATAVPGVYAQETSATVRGAVSTSSGEALAGATVVVTSSATGVSKTVTTDAGGLYSVRGLPAGVSYDIAVDANGWQKASTAGLSLAVGQSEVINYRLDAEEEVIVMATRVAVDTAVGPSAVFNLASLQDSPAINRNINDIIQQDPRLYVDQSSNVDAVQCNGANPRYNSLTVDGVRLNDGFGLNSNGYPTQRMPFPFDAISSVAVELAPMDVVYGGFSACNINAVTKTGSNEFFGSVFFDYASDSLRGDKLEGDSVESQDYDETRWGFELGGAIIPDKLFFYGAYEKYDGADLNNRGAIGTGAVNEVPVTQAELDEIARISREVYGFEPGRTAAEAFDFEDEKYLLKADWYINEAHRLSAT
ncbi:MAG: cell envelope biogenesis protein OmpA, partial [Alteromonadaceae bacterium]|nr:cell envelope biogenesis protein OmpA [Alteromonadaceae bacterium]